MTTKAQPWREIVMVREQFRVGIAVLVTQNLYLMKQVRTIHTLYPCRLPGFEIVCNYLRCNHWMKDTWGLLCAIFTASCESIITSTQIVV